MPRFLSSATLYHGFAADRHRDPFGGMERDPDHAANPPEDSVKFFSSIR
jgi:hypothetical protein